MTLNEAELGDMAAQAERLGCRFRFDSAIFPCLPDGSAAPLDLRVSPERAVEWDMAFPDRRGKWMQAVDRPSPALHKGDPVYKCGAGATSFYADPYGNLSPCLMTTHYRYKGAGGQFQQVWKEQLGEIRERKRTRDGGCMSGALRNTCTHCPAFNYLETGDEEKDSPYMEKTAILRMDAIMKHKQEENQA
jgi:radical SAM protein with 4Fe4S-binding SPASM domain